MRLLGAEIIRVQVGQASKFMVMVRGSRHGNDEWIVMAGSMQWDLLDFFCGHVPADLSQELQQVCHEIHALLTSTAGSTDVRGYLEGRRSQSAAVWTPEELPWRQA